MPGSTDSPIPFYETPSWAVERRLLLISYHFPPGEAAGALRWQKLSRHLVERGWGLDVLTLDPGMARDADSSALADLAPNTRVYGVPSRPPTMERLEHACRSALSSVRRPARDSGLPIERPESIHRDEVRRGSHLTRRGLVRAYAAWREHARNRRWAMEAVERAAAIARPGAHRAIVTSGPPHMAHEAGRVLSERIGLPLIMDMRDPWSLIERLPEGLASPLWLRRAESLERMAVARADLVVMNTHRATDAMKAAYPELADRIITVMNGPDIIVPSSPPEDEGGRFVMTYAGEIYLDRDPRPLLQAAAEVVHGSSLAPTEFGLEFIGDCDTYNSIPLAALLEPFGLDRHVTISARIPRRRLTERLARASMLVSLPQDSHMSVPSKIFEYMQFESWILALCEPSSATWELLQRTDADLVRPGYPRGIAAVIRKRYEQHSRGERPKALALDRRFSRERQAQVLSDAIDRCLGRRPASSTAGSGELSG